MMMGAASRESCVWVGGWGGVGWGGVGAEGRGVSRSARGQARAWAGSSLMRGVRARLHFNITPPAQARPRTASPTCRAQAGGASGPAATHLAGVVHDDGVASAQEDFAGVLIHGTLGVGDVWHVPGGWGSVCVWGGGGGGEWVGRWGRARDGDGEASAGGGAREGVRTAPCAAGSGDTAAGAAHYNPACCRTPDCLQRRAPPAVLHRPLT